MADVDKYLLMHIKAIDEATAPLKKIGKSLDGFRKKTYTHTKAFLDRGKRMAFEQKFMNKEMSGGAQQLVDNATKINKLGQSYDSLGGSFKMPLEKWIKFNQEGGKFDSIGGRVGNSIRKMTHGFRGFRMEMLGVMFFGMAIQKMFMGLLQPALQMSGALELLSVVLGLMFLPVGLALIDLIIDLWNWWEKQPESIKGLIRTLVVLGAAIGGILMVIGQFALGIGSIIQAFGWVVGPIISFIGWIIGIGVSILSIFGPWLLLIALLFGLSAPLVGASDSIGSFGESTKSIFSSISSFVGGKIRGIIDWIDGLWEKFLDWGPVNDFLIKMGMTTESIEKLKNPIETVRNFLDTWWDGFIQKHPKIIELASKLGLTVNELSNPIENLGTIVSKTFSFIWDEVKKYWGEFIDLLKENEFINSLITKLGELTATLGELAESMNKLMSSGFMKFFDMIMGAQMIEKPDEFKRREAAGGATPFDLFREPKPFTGAGTTGEWDSITKEQGDDIFSVLSQIAINTSGSQGTGGTSSFMNDNTYNTPHTGGY